MNDRTKTTTPATSARPAPRRPRPARPARHGASRRSIGALLAGLLLALTTTVARAEQFQQFGDLQVHYNVFNSTSISADMAARYDLRRGEDIALVNVAGRRVLDDGTTRAVRLAVDGTVQNLLGQMRETRFDLIEEPEAIYYMLSTRFSDRETLRFDLTVVDTETGRTWPMQFQKELWKQ